VLLASTTVVILLVVGVLAYGYWDTYIRPAREAAVKVGDRTDNMTYFVKRLKLALSESGPSLNAAQIAAMPTQLAQQIIDEEVLLQRAKSLGVSVSNDDIDAYLAEQQGIPFTRDAAGHIQHSAAFENAVRSRLEASGLTLAEYRRAMHGELLQQQVRKHFEDTLPEALPAVHLRKITVADEAKAKDVKQRLDGGADFAQIAASESTDTATKSAGGLQDWTPVDLLPTELQQAVNSLSAGQVSDPIKVDNGYTIVKVEEKTDSRQLTDKDRTALADKQLNDWMTQQRAELHAKSYMVDKARQNYALDKSDAVAIAARNSENAPGQGLPGGQTIPISPGGGLPSSMPQTSPGGTGGAAPSGGGNP
jgi:parvulin-like peptidyl-prolyl isomerase